MTFSHNVLQSCAEAGVRGEVEVRVTRVRLRDGVMVGCWFDAVGLAICRSRE